MGLGAYVLFRKFTVETKRLGNLDMIRNSSYLETRVSGGLFVCDDTVSTHNSNHFIDPMC